MHLIIYTSQYVGDIDEIDKVLSDITITAKINNLESGITGLLFYHNNYFVQVIEGERDTLEGLISILENDNRHKNIERVVDEEINKRKFSDWNMDSFNLSEEDKIDPEELKKILDVYRNVLKVDAKSLVGFFKVMIGSREDIS
jgi:hypothetical protein